MIECVIKKIEYIHIRRLQNTTKHFRNRFLILIRADVFGEENNFIKITFVVPLSVGSTLTVDKQRK